MWPHPVALFQPHVFCVPILLIAEQYSHRLLRECCCYKKNTPNRITFLTVRLFPPMSPTQPNTTVDVIEKYKINGKRCFLHYMTIVYYDLYYPVQVVSFAAIQTPLPIRSAYKIKSRTEHRHTTACLCVGTRTHFNGKVHCFRLLRVAVFFVWHLMKWQCHYN